MAIHQVLPTLAVQIPELRASTKMPQGLTLINMNPYVPFPFSDIRATSWVPGEGTFEADVSEAFVEATIRSRGRPHFSLTHAGFIDDAIAAAAFTGTTGETYGARYRYIEFDVGISFHREAFPRGSVSVRQSGTVVVDHFVARWELLPQKDRIPIMRRGIFRVSILGVRDKDQIPIASIQGNYMRRKALH